MQLSTFLPARIARIAALFLSLATVSATALAQDYPPSWSEPFPGLRVVANLYAVGTSDLGVYLLTSDDGHILVNTGLPDSVPLIRENIESLGFRLEDVKILLTNQAHYDHVSALAEMKDLTGAELWATKADAKLLEDGGATDPLFGGHELFRPVTVDHFIADGDVIELGDTRLTVHAHPGHTAGSASYSMRVRENGRDYNVIVANFGSINPGTRFLERPTYPGIADDYARTFKAQKALDVDIWVAAHGSQYGLHEKYRPGQAYATETFLDPEGFQAMVERMEQAYVKALADEK